MESTNTEIITCEVILVRNAKKTPIESALAQVLASSLASAILLRHATTSTDNSIRHHLN
jgi:hypothetical protein